MTKIYAALWLFILTLSAPLSASVAEPFGEDLYVQIKPAHVTTEDLDRIAEAGFGGVRFSILWYVAERKTGTYAYDAPVHVKKDGRKSMSYAQLIDELAKRDLKMLVLLFSGHPQHTGPWQDFDPPQKKLLQKAKSRRLLPPPVKPEEIIAFGDFAAHTAAHFSRAYGAERFVWTIWNEPNLWGFYPPEPNPQSFAPLLTESCKAIRSAVPNAVINGPGFATDGDTWWGTDLDFVRDMLNTSNALKCLDSISFHPYRPVAPETVGKTYTEIRAALAPWQPHGKDVLIAVDEWGYSLRSGPVLPVDTVKQAQYLARSYLMNQLHGVSLSNLYEWRNSGEDLNEREHNFGLVTHDGAAKPSLVTFTRLLKELKGYSLEKRLLPEGCSDDTYILLYNGAQGQKIAAWHVSGVSSLNFNGGVGKNIPINAGVSIFTLADERSLWCAE